MEGSPVRQRWLWTGRTDRPLSSAGEDARGLLCILNETHAVESHVFTKRETSANAFSLETGENLCVTAKLCNLSDELFPILNSENSENSDSNVVINSVNCSDRTMFNISNVERTDHTCGTSDAPALRAGPHISDSNLISDSVNRDCVVPIISTSDDASVCSVYTSSSRLGDPAFQGDATKSDGDEKDDNCVQSFIVANSYQNTDLLMDIPDLNASSVYNSCSTLNFEKYLKQENNTITTEYLSHDITNICNVQKEIDIDTNVCFNELREADESGVNGVNLNNNAGHVNPVSSVVPSLIDLCSMHITTCCKLQVSKEFIAGCNARSIVNLSDHVLSDTELKLLQRGLTFCPTPGEPNMADEVRFRCFPLKCKIKSTFRQRPAETEGLG